MSQDLNLTRTAATIRDAKNPFKSLTRRDKAYLGFLAKLAMRHGGRVTLAQIANSAEILNYSGSNKPHDAGAVTRLVKAGLIATSQDILSLSVTRQGNELLAKLAVGDGAKAEIDRIVALGKVASRPDQEKFSRKIRALYGNKCAVTGCMTREALEAAHIRVDDEHLKDFNDAENGILLRADIHALFDAKLITLTPDGNGIEVSPELSDPSYAFLRDIKITNPLERSPSRINIEHHRSHCNFLKVPPSNFRCSN